MYIDITKLNEKYLSDLTGDEYLLLTDENNSSKVSLQTISNLLASITPIEIIESIQNDILDQAKTWEYYVSNWSVEPILNTSLENGDVYDYELDGIVRYRYVPNVYVSTEDVFYENFDGFELTNPIVGRG